jgi:hypothetical protein
MKRFRLSGASNISVDGGLPSRHLTTVASALQHAMKHLFDPYQPELHYMRGRPGPKWQEKHAIVPPLEMARPLQVRTPLVHYRGESTERSH